MKILSSKELRQVTGGISYIFGPFTTFLSNVSFYSGFQVTVTSRSKCVLGHIEFQSGKVIDHSNGDVLFDGTNNSFCINGASFKALPVGDGWFSYFFGNGNTYKCLGSC